MVATLLVVIFGASFLAQQLEDDAGEHLQEAALRVRDGLEAFLAMHQSAIGSVSVQLRPKPGQPVSEELAGQLMEATIARYSGFLTMLVTDAEGRILRASRRFQSSFTPGPGDNQWVNDRPYFQQPMRTRKDFLSGVFQGRGLGKDPIVAMSSPILDSEGNFLGIIEGSLDITRIPLAPRQFHHPLVVVAHDASGNVVYSSHPRAYAPLQLWAPLPISSTTRPGDLFHFTDSSLRDFNGDVIPQYALRLPLQSAGWQVIATLAAREVDREIREFYLLASLAFLLLSLLAWQAARIIARSISTPIVSLVGDIQRFDPESITGIAIRDDFSAREIAQIHAEFVRMGSRLRESFGHLRKAIEERDSTNLALHDVLLGLDQTVAERTAQLADSESRYRQVVERSGDIIYRTDLRGIIEFHNPAFEKLLGHDCIGRSIADLVEPSSRAAVLERLARQLDQRVPSILLELPVHGVQQGICWIGQSNQLLLDETGEPIGFQAIARDVTEQKLATLALSEAEERYALAVSGSNNGIWDWDLRTHKVYYSDRWRQMFGIDPGAVLEDPDDWLRRIHPADSRAMLTALETFLKQDSKRLFEQEHRMRHEDGTWRWVLTSGAAVRATDGTALRVAGSTTDVTTGKLEDPLTGLPNRLAIVERIEQLMARHGEDPSRQFALLFMDLDRFKMINDSLGHVVGDELLFAVSRRVMAALNDFGATRATLGRLGGDEFVVVVEQDRDPDLAVNIAQAILREMNAPHQLNGSLIFASMSIGLASAEPGLRNAEDLLRNADTAMYQAKTLGRGRYCVFDNSMHARAVARLELETDLRRALDTGEFLLHYQAQVNLQTGRLSGFEALVRWNHPKRGLVPPVEFISAAEENGLILPLGRWVLEEGVRQLAAWDRECEAARYLAISINLSPMQFADPSLRSIIESILKETGIAPARLHLEITESMVADDPKEAQAILRSLSQMGVGLEVDDFGTGYSCLSQLHQLPFDTLKIDRTFVQAMDQHDEGRQQGGMIVESIVNLSSSLGIEVIAEGIETQRHWTRLARLGCQYGQGYYFSKPLPGPLALELLQLRSESPWPPPTEIASMLPDLTQLELKLQETTPLPKIHSN